MLSDVRFLSSPPQSASVYAGVFCSPSFLDCGNLVHMANKSTKCPICSELKDREMIAYKDGWPREEYFPKAYSKLKDIKLLTEEYTSRPHTIMQCPECDQHYYHEVDYDYMPNGSDNDEILTKITAKEAKKHLGEE